MSTWQLLLTHPLTERLGWTLVHSLWELAALALVLGFVYAFVRSAQGRYLAACATLILMAAAPVVTFPLVPERPRSMRVTTGPLPRVTFTLAAPPVDAVLEPAAPLPAAPVAVSAPVTAPRWNADAWRLRFRQALPYLPAFYAAGVTLLSLRLLAGYRRVRRLARGTPAPAAWQQTLDRLARRLAIARPVTLLQSALTEVPTVLGALKPVILVPIAALTELTPAQLEALLAHELAHIRRHDYLVNLLQVLLETLLFYHPATWWVSSRIRQEREHCCDDIAAALAGGPFPYAAALASMEELRAPTRLLPAARTGQLLPRIRRLLTPPDAGATRVTRTLAGGLALMLVLAAIVLAYLPACSKPGEKPTTTQAASQAADVEHVVLAPTPSPAPPEDPEDQASRRVRERLNANYARIDLDGAPFADAIKRFAADTKLDLYADWKTLEAAGIKRDTPVSVNLRDVPIRKVLAALLSEAGGSTVGLGYSIDEGVIVISTKRAIDAAKPTIVRVYDIRDLFVQPESVDENLKPIPLRDRAVILAEILDTIKTTVDPDSWCSKDNPNAPGNIRELNGQLIVIQTKDNHIAVYNLLNQLCEPRSLQINMEARFLSVDDATLKALAKYLPASVHVPATRPATTAPATLSAATILTDADFKEVLRITRSSPATSAITAPRITLFNGQGGYLKVASEQTYTAGYDPATLKPVTKLLETGPAFYVNATVSADRKYVVAKLKPTFTWLLDMAKAPAPDVPADKHLQIDVPRTHVASINTLVSIPDGGTVVLGAGRVPGERELAPAPGEAPATGPAFVKEDRTLLVLVRPKIIIQREIPGGSAVKADALRAQRAALEAQIEAESHRLGPTHPKMNELRQGLEALKAAAGTTQGSPVVDRAALLNRQAGLEGRLTEAERQYGPGHPVVVGLRHDLEDVKDRLADKLPAKPAPPRGTITITAKDDSVHVVAPEGEVSAKELRLTLPATGPVVAPATGPASGPARAPALGH